MSMTGREGLSYDIPVHILKYTLATLIQGVAPALGHQFLQRTAHGFYSIQQMIQLRKFSLAERSPAFGSASDVAETKKQVSNFSQRKTKLACALNDCQPVNSCGVVPSLPAHSRGPGKQSNSLVIPDGRGLESNLSRHLGNRQFGHKHILDHRFPSTSATRQSSSFLINAFPATSSVLFAPGGAFRRAYSVRTRCSREMSSAFRYKASYEIGPDRFFTKNPLP
jgi:hypothetical protein